MRRAGLAAKCVLMLSIDEARAAVLAEARPLPAEEIDIARRSGASSRRTSPPPGTYRASPTARWTASRSGPARQAGG
jgi:hypothetical protein